MKLNNVRYNILILHTIVVVICFLANVLFLSGNGASLLLVVSLWNIFIFSFLLYYELKLAKDFHPFMLMLVAAIQFVGLNGIYIFLDLIEGKRFLFGIYDITDYLTKGSLYVTLEHLLLYWGFHFVEVKNKRNNPTIMEELQLEPNMYYTIALFSYLVIWLLRIVNFVISFRSIASILVNIVEQGQLVTIMLILFACLKHPQKVYLVSHWCIVSLEILLALHAGMKEVIIQLLIPYFFYLCILYKMEKKIINVGFSLKILAIGAFVLFVVFPYVSLWRQMNWNEKRGASVSRVLDEYVNYMQGESVYNTTSNRSSDEMISRAGAIEQNTFPIMYSENYGLTPKYLYYTLISFVPRIIWRSKPPIRLGYMIHSLALGKSNWEEVPPGNGGVAYAIGFIGACFFSLGPIFALTMPFLLGCFISKIWYFYKERIGNSVIAIWGIINIFRVILKDFEAFSDGGIAFIVWHSIYCLLIIIIEKRTYKQ